MTTLEMTTLDELNKWWNGLSPEEQHSEKHGPGSMGCDECEEAPIPVWAKVAQQERE